MMMRIDSEKKIAAAVVLGGLLLAFATYLFGGASVALSSQVAFWSSALVIAASFDSYRRMVRQRLDAMMIPAGTDRDMLDRIEDPYDLYGENNEDTQETDNIKNLVADEKQRMKKSRRDPAAVAKDSIAAFSLARIGAYIVLAAGFFYLKGSGNWHPAPYLLSLAVPVVIVVSLLMMKGNGTDERTV